MQHRIEIFLADSQSGIITQNTMALMFVTAWCEPTLHICGTGMASTLQHGVNRHCLTKAYLWHVCKGPVRRSMVGSSTAHLWRTKKHADDKNRTILMRQPHARCATAANGSGKGASVGERPTREHLLAINGEKASLHSTARLRSLTWICIARYSNLSMDCLTWAASSELRNCTDSITKESSVFAVIITRAS